LCLLLNASKLFHFHYIRFKYIIKFSLSYDFLLLNNYKLNSYINDKNHIFEILFFTIIQKLSLLCVMLILTLCSYLSFSCKMSLKLRTINKYWNHFLRLSTHSSLPKSITTQFAIVLYITEMTMHRYLNNRRFSTNDSLVLIDQSCYLLMK